VPYYKEAASGSCYNGARNSGAPRIWQICPKMADMDTIAVRVEKSGRILIPSAIRKKLNLTAGSEVLLHVDDASVTVTTREQVLERIRAIIRKNPPARSMADDLLADRRCEAAIEDAK
jgi:AbrB family looped-hinge helix DNA binding protein